MDGRFVGRHSTIYGGKHKEVVMAKSTVRVGILASLLLGCGIASADSVILRDGRHIRGKFSGGTQGVIAFSVGGTTQYYDTRNVLAMTFGDETENQESPEQQQVVPILPNNSYLRPNKTTPPEATNSKVKHTSYIPDKNQPRLTKQ